jgi:sterol desaturase/sphingolipid hydroxylase (fatty acid hydroxylase superfamily)
MDQINEPFVRLASFAGVLALMAGLEALAPRRRLTAPRGWRWANNLALVAVNSLCVRLLFPLAGVGFALLAQERGWGLFNVVAAPGWLAFAVCFVLLDLVIWGQHVGFHRTPALWRLHRMHHADTDIDASTGLRFHPLEIVLSMVVKFAAVAALGAPPLAVLAFEVALNATSMFNHANVRLPAGLDAALRRVIVTPDMHRVHHSVDPLETHSNFGFNLSVWDRLFGLYRAQPALGHDAMAIGLPIFRDERELRLDRLITQPFRRPEPPEAPAQSPIGPSKIIG